MIGIIWNCRGVSKKGMATCIKGLMADFHPDLLGLQETMRKNYSDKFLRKIDPSRSYTWHWLPSKGRSGGILCAVKEERFEILSWEEKEFSLSVSMLDQKAKKELKVITVYGPAHDDKKGQFLTELSNICADSNTPMLIGGDFNIMRYSTDKNKNFTGNRFTDMFNWIINTYEMRDSALNGGAYTWSNNQEDPTLEKLDRILINEKWELDFPMTNLRKIARYMYRTREE